jgi:hypothetical protein
MRCYCSLPPSPYGSGLRMLPFFPLTDAPRVEAAESFTQITDKPGKSPPHRDN